MPPELNRLDWEYVTKPFETLFLARLDEIRTLVSLSSYAIANLQGSARLVKLLRHPDERVDQARRLEHLAQEELKNEFPVLHGAGAVLTWGALEAAIKDFLVRLIATSSAALQVEGIGRLRVTVGDYEALKGEDRARYLLTLFERDLAASMKPGVGRFECVLHPFHIVPAVSDTDRRVLAELAAVRNVIVHRGGNADGRLLQLCPWLGLQVGQSVRISGTAFRRYAAAAGNYAASIIESAQKVLQSSGTSDPA